MIPSKNIKVTSSCDSNTGELTYTVNGDCLLLIRLDALNQNHKYFQPDLEEKLMHALQQAYNHGYWDAKEKAEAVQGAMMPVIKNQNADAINKFFDTLKPIWPNLTRRQTEIEFITNNNLCRKKELRNKAINAAKQDTIEWRF